MKYKTEIGPDHVLIGWMVRHCAWVVNNCQVKGTGRTPYCSIRGKDYTGEVMPFGEICLGRNHSEDGAKLNMRWMRGVFVGKLDRTDEFLMLTPTGAMKTRCVRRLEGDNAWNLQFLNLCVGSPWNATARSTQQTPTIQQKDELDSGRRAKSVFATEHFGQIRTHCGMPRLCRGNRPCTSYSRTNNYVQIMATTLRTLLRITTSRLSTNAMNNKNTIAHMDAHNTQY